MGTKIKREAVVSFLEPPFRLDARQMLERHFSENSVEPCVAPRLHSNVVCLEHLASISILV